MEQDTQDRIADIQRNANRSREDIERDFQRDFQDRVRDYTLELGEILDDTSLSPEQRQEAIAELQSENAELARTQGFDRLRGLEDLGIRQGRRREDVGIRQGRGERDINTAAQEALLSIQQETAALEMTNALTVGETATLNATTAVMASEATLQLSSAAGLQELAGMTLHTAGLELSEIRTDFQVVLNPLADTINNLAQLLTISLQGAEIQPRLQSAGFVDTPQGNQQQPPTGNMVAVFNIDGKEVADAIAVPMGENLARTTRHAQNGCWGDAIVAIII